MPLPPAVKRNSGSRVRFPTTVTPIERAILAFIEPHILTTEREFLEKNQFKVVFKPFDWSLNDLTGRGGR